MTLSPRRKEWLENRLEKKFNRAIDAMIDAQGILHDLGKGERARTLQHILDQLNSENHS